MNWNFNLNPNQSLTGNTFGVNPNQSPVPMTNSPTIYQPGNTDPLTTKPGIDWSSMSTWFGDSNSQGIVPIASNALGTGLNAWLGMQSLDLANRQLQFQESAFNKNYQNQRELTNRALYDRQAARAAGYGQDFSQSFKDWKANNNGV